MSRRSGLSRAERMPLVWRFDLDGCQDLAGDDGLKGVLVDEVYRSAISELEALLF